MGAEMVLVEDAGYGGMGGLAGGCIIGAEAGPAAGPENPYGNVACGPVGVVVWTRKSDRTGTGCITSPLAAW